MRIGLRSVFSVAQRTMKVIIDTDPGLDDAMAVLIALDAHKKGLIKILGVTLTHGNTSLDNAACNMMRTLTTVKMEKEIPVFKGAVCPFLEPYPSRDSPFHGHDGFGDAKFESDPDLSLISKEHAVSAITRFSRENPGEVVLIALGPLTNVALAMRMDPSLGGNLKEIFIMGGNSEGLGNVTPCAEFNFHCDPEAAYTVLQECKCPTYLITWELCLKRAELTLDWRKNVLGKVSTPEARLMNSIEAKSLSLYKYQTYIVCDQIAVAVAIYRNLIIASSDHYASVELHGMFTRGQMVVDYISAMNRKPNVTMVEKIDVEAFKKILMVAFGHKVEM